MLEHIDTNARTYRHKDNIDTKHIDTYTRTLEYIDTGAITYIHIIMLKCLRVESMALCTRVQSMTVCVQVESMYMHE